MSFSPEQTWLLIIGAIAAILAFNGLVGIIDGAVKGWRQAQEYKRWRRLQLRNNINQLIVELCEEDDRSLDRALQDSIIEYRVLS
jgi:hypothetical protein